MKRNLVTISNISRLSIIKLKLLMNIIYEPNKETEPIMILGHGRSGTTMMVNIFQRDWRFEVHSEMSKESMKNFRIKKNSLTRIISKSSFPKIIFKSTKDPFFASEVLRSEANFKVVWMIRNYNSVINSGLRFWGDSYANVLRELVFNDEISADNWLYHKICNSDLEYIRNLPLDSLQSQDWIALIWWIVNKSVFVHNLNSNRRFKLVNYESIVSKTDYTLKKVYSFLSVEYFPRENYIYKSSLENGSKKILNADVEELCASLYKKLLENS